MSSVAGSPVVGSIVQIGKEQVRGHVDEVVRRSVEETLKRPLGGRGGPALWYALTAHTSGSWRRSPVR
jgi:hypothetical protein